LYLRLQEWLRGRLARPLDPSERALYGLEVLWLRRVFGADERRGKSKAKRHELALCPKLLTVCVGSRATEHDPRLGGYGVLLEGCGRVISETPKSQGGGTMHLIWCHACAPARNRRNRKKDALAARRASLHRLTD
jgi:hypothetical protein